MADLVQSIGPVARILLAAILAVPLGWEREAEDKPAGLRTHMLVAMGAAAFVVVAVGVSPQMLAGGDALQLDPLRIVDGVAGGIGFIGAGTILRARGSVHGLTTAANVWVAAALGVSAGFGRFDIAATLSVGTLAVLLLPQGLARIGVDFGGRSSVRDPAHDVDRYDDRPDGRAARDGEARAEKISAGEQRTGQQRTGEQRTGEHRGEGGPG